MNKLEEVTRIIERARIDGGWDDEIVAEKILDAMGLDENGEPVSDLKQADETVPPAGEG